MKARGDLARRGRSLAAPLVALLALVGAGFCASRLSTASEARSGEESEIPFFPSGRFLDLLSFGEPTALADVAWLEAIQYYGKHHLGDRRYPLAAHLFDIATRCDPAFRSAYIFGGLVLGEEAEDMPAARSLMDRGIAANPGDWMVPFQKGFLEYTRGEMRIGAVEMERASRLPGAPPFTARLSAQACAHAGKRELAIRLWEEMATSADDATRALALERLRELRGGGSR